jgi:hypothetical protein
MKEKRKAKRHGRIAFSAGLRLAESACGRTSIVFADIFEDAPAQRLMMFVWRCPSTNAFYACLQ